MTTHQQSKKATTTSSTSTPSLEVERRIDTLFIRMGSIYGHLWCSTFKSETMLKFAKKEWSDSLKGFNNGTIKESLEKLRSQKPLPPTLPQFLELCQSIEKRLEDCGLKRKIIKSEPTDFGRKQLQSLRQHLGQ